MGTDCGVIHNACYHVRRKFVFKIEIARRGVYERGVVRNVVVTGKSILIALYCKTPPRQSFPKVRHDIVRHGGSSDFDCAGKEMT